MCKKHFNIVCRLLTNPFVVIVSQLQVKSLLRKQQRVPKNGGGGGGDDDDDDDDDDDAYAF